MATLTRKTKPDPTAHYVAWTSFAAADFDGAVTRGDVRRGDDPVVQRHFEYFVVDGTPESDWTGQLDEFFDSYVPRERPAQPAGIPDAEAAIAIESVWFPSGRHVSRGQRLRRDDPIVRENPAHFVTPPMPLGD